MNVTETAKGLTQVIVGYIKLLGYHAKLCKRSLNKHPVIAISSKWWAMRQLYREYLRLHIQEEDVYYILPNGRDCSIMYADPAFFEKLAVALQADCRRENSATVDQRWGPAFLTQLRRSRNKSER
jgi:hypothetical protein